MLLCEVDGSALCDDADGGGSSAADAAPEEMPAAATALAAAAVLVAAEQPAPAKDAPAAPAAAAAEPAVVADDFIPASRFEGAKPGFAFKLGKHGLGYYADVLYSSPNSGGNTSGGSSGGGSDSSSGPSSKGKSVRFNIDGSIVEASRAVAPPTPAAAEGEPPAGERPPMPRAAPAAGPLPPGPRHHWGQALQYLDRAVPVAPGRKLALLARREDGKLRFALRQGVGEPVGRAPWKIEWGGGASIENPHYQRVHYCELLVGAAGCQSAPLQRSLQRACVLRACALHGCSELSAGSLPLARPAAVFLCPLWLGRCPARGSRLHQLGFVRWPVNSNQ